VAVVLETVAFCPAALVGLALLALELCFCLGAAVLGGLEARLLLAALGAADLALTDREDLGLADLGVVRAVGVDLALDVDLAAGGDLGEGEGVWRRDDGFRGRARSAVGVMLGSANGRSEGGKGFIAGRTLGLGRRPWREVATAHERARSGVACSAGAV